MIRSKILFEEFQSIYVLKLDSFRIKNEKEKRSVKQIEKITSYCKRYCIKTLFWLQFPWIGNLFNK